MSTFGFVALGSMAAALLAACGASVDTSERAVGVDDGLLEDRSMDALTTADDPIEVHVTEARLYEEPRHVPNPSCDLHTRLELATAGGRGRAELARRVTGLCEIHVVPHRRAYALRLTGVPCGSKVYEGQRRTGRGLAGIRITDHRTRRCRDIVPAKIVVEESVPTETGRETTTLYSYDGPSVDERVTLEGTLRATVGIGGENTGTSVQTNGGLTELVLTPEQQALFEDGRHALVRGTPTILTGVETGERWAVAVTSLVVCPAPGSTLDCMPRVDVPPPSVCAAENGAFVQRCPGVTVVY